MLSYEIKGEGPALVFLHGFLCSSDVWECLIPLLERDFQLVMIDLPGHGASLDVQMESMSQIVSDVIKVTKALNLKKYHLLGHSMGGYVALALMAQVSSQIMSLTLLHSTPFADSEEKKMQRLRAIKAVKKTRMLFVRQFIARLFAARNVEACYPYIRDLENTAEGISKHTIIQSMQIMKDRPSYAQLLKNTEVPVRLILGLDDPVVDFISLLQYYRTSNVKIHSLSETGHMGFYECPERCSQIIRESLLV